MQSLRAAGWGTTGWRGWRRDGRGQEFAALFFFFFKECCVAHMSVCPATAHSMEWKGKGRGENCSPFFLSFHSRRTSQGFAEASPLCNPAQSTRLMPFHLHRIEITPRPFRAQCRTERIERDGFKNLQHFPSGGQRSARVSRREILHKLQCQNSCHTSF